LAGYAQASIDGNYDHFWRSKAVKAELRERMRKIAAKTDMTLEKTMKYLAELLTLTPGDLVDEEGKILKPGDIPPDVARYMNFSVKNGRFYLESIDKLRVIETMAKLGGWVQETLTIRDERDSAARIIAARQNLALLPPPKEIIDVRADLVSEGPGGEAGSEGQEEVGGLPGASEPGDEAPLGEAEEDMGS
jgi:hypothetical protein